MSDLVKLARAYLQAKRVQELDHTDPVLDWQRSEAHEAFMIGLDVAGVAYRDREHATEIAVALEEVQSLARDWLDADRARWVSLIRAPFNGRTADHWRLAAEAAVAWASYTEALKAIGLEIGDRRQFAQELVSDGD